jgi:hypothetical protein
VIPFATGFPERVEPPRVTVAVKPEEHTAAVVPKPVTAPLAQYIKVSEVVPGFGVYVKVPFGLRPLGFR